MPEQPEVPEVGTWVRLPDIAVIGEVVAAGVWIVRSATYGLVQRATGDEYERFGPAGWPPQPGQVWSVAGQPHWVVEHGGDLRLVGRTGVSRSADDVVAECAAEDLWLIW